MKYSEFQFILIDLYLRNLIAKVARERKMEREK